METSCPFARQTHGGNHQHQYHRRRLGCPCPGVAILINHGYLKPLDEDDPIHVTRLTTALVQCFNLSWIHAAFLSLLACILCGSGLAVSVAQLGIHDRIEHDASLTRYDFGKGDHLNPDRYLIDRFLTRTPDTQKVSLDDYAFRRAELYASEKIGVSIKTQFTALGETGLTLSIFGKENSYINSAALRTIFSEERLPRGYIRPKKPVTITKILKIAWILNQKTRRYMHTSNEARHRSIGGPVRAALRWLLEYLLPTETA